MRCGTGFIPMTADQKKMMKYSIYNNMIPRGLPRKVDLSSQMPPAGNQGQQGSCSAFATVYHHASSLFAKREKWTFDKKRQGGSGLHLMSPAYTYNQIRRGKGSGSNFYGHFTIMKAQGVAPLFFMKYNASDSATQPSAEAFRFARFYKATGSRSVNSGKTEAIKAELAGGNTLCTSIGIYENFSTYAYEGKVIDYNQGSCRGGHAIVFVGYDDDKVSPKGHRGAFKFLNSWGVNWGKNGYGWVSYKYAAANNMSGLILEIDNKKKKPFVSIKVLPPRNISATRGTEKDSIKVTWTTVVKAKVYRIERKGPGKKVYKNIGFSKIGEYRDTAVQRGAAYSYRIVTITDKGASDPKESPVAEGYISKVKKIKPGKIMGFKVWVSGASVISTWNRTSGAENYILYRFDINGSKKWEKLSNVSPHYYKDSTVVGGHRYYYIVKAQNTSGFGPWSTALSVVVPDISTKPGEVKGLTVSDGLYPDKIVVTWKGVKNSDYYYLWRENTSTGKYDFSKKVKANSYIDKAQNTYIGITYNYYVCAVNKYGNGAYSSPVKGRLLYLSSRGLSAPDSPRGVSVWINKRYKQAYLSWKKAKGAKRYEVFLKKGSSTQFKYVTTVKKNSYFHRVIPGVLYGFRIRAVKSKQFISRPSQSVYAFINKPRKMERSLVNKSQGSKSFTGIWNGIFWDGGSLQKRILLKISMKKNRIVTELSVNNTSIYKASGFFVAGSKSISAGHLTLRLHHRYEELSYLTISDKNILGQETRISLKRGGE